MNLCVLDFHCPIIQILVEGDEFSIQTVFETIKRGWPVLIIETGNDMSVSSNKYYNVNRISLYKSYLSFYFLNFREMRMLPARLHRDINIYTTSNRQEVEITVVF
jgi:hypothetical protein